MSGFKVKVGVNVKDDNRDITIIDQEYREKINNNKKSKNEKWYKYKCLKCGYNEGWMIEGSLLQGKGCSCCCKSPRVVVEGINSVVDTDPWMIPFFQGGYDEAKLYTAKSNKKITPTCPICGKLKEKSISIKNIYYHHTTWCNCNNDGISYPEKFMVSVLNQLNIKFQTQLNKKTFKWCKEYRYDFYIEHINCIIETHGIHHYEETKIGCKSLKKEQENDKSKKELALKNGIEEKNYIVIDCRKSELDWIRNSIINSRLGKLFDLSQIDWLKCHEHALSNLVKIACDLWNKGIEDTSEISKIMKICTETVRLYLKNGNLLGWVKYKPEEQRLKNIPKMAEINKKRVGIYKDNILLKIFDSTHELEKQSEKVFGVKLLRCAISLVCNNKKPQYKGYTFKYI